MRNKHMQHKNLLHYMRINTEVLSKFSELQVLHKLLLLLEDVLELTQGGLHLLQGELVLTLSGLVLGHPGVELSDSVVKEGPLLDEDLNLLDPGVGDGLDLDVSLLKSSDLGISLSMGGHLLGSSIGSLKDLKEVHAVLLKGLDLVIKSLDLSQVGGLGQTLSGSLLSTSQPGVELLDASSVLGPVLDIVGVLVALNLGVTLELLDVVSDPLELILESLGISGDLVTLGKELKLILGILSKDLELGGDVLLEVHGPGNSVLREHGAGGLLDVLELSSGGILPGVKSLQGVVESCESSNKLLNFANSALESSKDLELLLNGLDLLGKSLLLVLGDGDAHGVEVVVDGGEEAIDAIISLLEDVLPLLQISIGSIK